MSEKEISELLKFTLNQQNCLIFKYYLCLCLLNLFDLVTGYLISKHFVLLYAAFVFFSFVVHFLFICFNVLCLYFIFSGTATVLG